jgi:integrase
MLILVPSSPLSDRMYSEFAAGRTQLPIFCQLLFRHPDWGRRNPPQLLSTVAGLSGARSKGEEVWPLPKDVKQAIDDYLKLDADRRKTLHSDTDAYLFQPHSNYRTLVFDKALSTRMVQNIVARWGRFTGVGDVSPHDLRRTAITRALEMGQSYRQVQMMSKHRDPKMVMRYDHGRENLDQNAVNFLGYDEE